MFKLKYAILSISFLVISEAQPCLGWLSNCFKRKPVGIARFRVDQQGDHSESERNASAGSGIASLAKEGSEVGPVDRYLFDVPEGSSRDSSGSNSKRK